MESWRSVQTKITHIRDKLVTGPCKNYITKIPDAEINTINLVANNVSAQFRIHMVYSTEISNRIWHQCRAPLENQREEVNAFLRRIHPCMK